MRKSKSLCVYYIGLITYECVFCLSLKSLIVRGVLRLGGRVFTVVFCDAVHDDGFIEVVTE